MLAEPEAGARARWRAREMSPDDGMPHGMARSRMCTCGPIRLLRRKLLFWRPLQGGLARCAHKMGKRFTAAHSVTSHLGPGWEPLMDLYIATTIAEVKTRLLRLFRSYMYQVLRSLSTAHGVSPPVVEATADAGESSTVMQLATRCQLHRILPKS